MEETRRRNANKGPRGKVSNFFVRDFAKAYEKTRSVTLRIEGASRGFAQRRSPQSQHRLSPDGQRRTSGCARQTSYPQALQEKPTQARLHRCPSQPRPKAHGRRPSSCRTPSRRAPSHRARTFPDGHRPFFRRPRWRPHPCRPPPRRPNGTPPLLYVRPPNPFSSLRDLRASSLSPRPSRQRP